MGYASCPPFRLCSVHPHTTGIRAANGQRVRTGPELHTRGDHRHGTTARRERARSADLDNCGNRRLAAEKGRHHTRGTVTADAESRYAGRWAHFFGSDPRPRQRRPRYGREFGGHLHRRDLLRTQSSVAQPAVRHGPHRGAAWSPGNAVRAQHDCRCHRDAHCASDRGIQRTPARRSRQPRLAQARRQHLRSAGRQLRDAPGRAEQQARNLSEKRNRARRRWPGHRRLSRIGELESCRRSVAVCKIRNHGARAGRRLRPARGRSFRRVGALPRNRSASRPSSAGQRHRAAGTEAPGRLLHVGGCRGTPQLGSARRLQPEISQWLDYLRRTFARLDNGITGLFADDQRHDGARRVLEPGTAHHVAGGSPAAFPGWCLHRLLRREDAAASRLRRHAEPPATASCQQWCRGWRPVLPSHSWDLCQPSVRSRFRERHPGVFPPDHTVRRTRSAGSATSTS
jgi:hypothetical protein